MSLRYPSPWFLMKIAIVAIFSTVVLAPGAFGIRIPDNQQTAAKWTANGFYSYPHPKERKLLPQEVMVEVTNRLGLELLAIHNENNENNIALSPYGALSVLVILGEGLQGDAVREIQDAAKLPNDISVIRVGLRDIHKHLKSYFFPKEGFLAGLTLNHENITFRPEYEDVLKFYGYDISSFNNALFPDSEDTTTAVPLETTASAASAATDMMDSDGSDTTTALATTTKAAATTSTETPSTTTPPAIKSETTTVTTEPPKVESTTVTITTTTEKPTTTTAVPTTTTTAQPTTTTTTTQPTTTLTTTKQPSTTTQATTTTTKATTTTTQPTTTTTTQPETTTTEINEETSTGIHIESEDETEIVTEIVTEFFTEIVEEDDTEVPVTEEGSAATEQPEADSLIPSSVTESTTTLESETTAVDQPTTQSTAAMDTSTEMSTLSMTQVATEQTAGAAREARSKEAIKMAPHKNTVRPKPRKPRSVMDYLLAKYYDNFYVPEDLKAGTTRTFLPSDKTFSPVPAAQVPANFLVYGKFRDYHVNFMQYDAVLPYYFVPYLSCVALSLPLDSANYYLLLLLPTNERGIDKLIHDLRLGPSLKEIVRNLRQRHVVATIPSFTLKGFVNLTPTLQRLGVRRIFEPRQADFSPMTNYREDVYITNIEQAITVNIRNYVDPGMLQEDTELRKIAPLEFTADHPFLYFVMDSDLHVSLMAGKIVNPTNSRIR
ncbi:unnamed protein product [Acanthoscelides obtectus]|uniref:Serpin domain-containing protein n=1 Tax=Acanthoscelides obtectus TaxID=200917 RepID=A0A9P0LEU8_ACAOB|nr:unnamed protein product [Acanthoscelides obtectus]CAK1636528.1 Zonadhesin [Acanthoscelides obtectus]